MPSFSPFVLSEYVRWSDADPAGIIRYDAYLRFYEMAEAELFRAAGLPLSDAVARGDVWLLRKVMHTEFHSPARLDERLDVETYFSRVGTTSLTLNFDTYSAEGHVLRATGHLVLVAVSKAAYEKRPLPADILEGIRPWVRPGAAEPVTR